MCYRFGGFLLGGAYFRNFTVYDERSFLNWRSTTVPNRRVGENPGNEGSTPRFKIIMVDGIDLTDFVARLRNSLLDLSRRLQCNASEDTLDFVRFRLQQILQHLVHFGGGLDGVPQSITDIRLFCVRVILSPVEGSAFCSLKARQTNALVHVFLRWKYGENAAGCLLPLPLLFPLNWPAGSLSFGVQGLRSEFSRPEFTRHPNQKVVFLQFKNDSSSDSSSLIQNKYDSFI